MVALLAIAVMMARGIKGAIIYGILGASVIGWLTNAYDPWLDGSAGTGADGWVCALPDATANCIYASAPDLGDIFDTAGTLYSVGRQAGYVDEDDKLEKADEAFMADAAATIVGAAVGTSTTTTYIESAAGIEEGGKTGLVAVTVGVLMLSGLFLAGLFKAIPQFAAACALVAIGAMMMRQAADIDWKNKEMALPAFLTIVMMPFAYSIAVGIAAGCVSWVLIKMGMQKFNEVSPVMYGIAAFLIMYYVGPGTGNTFQWIFSYIF